jgi:hypothetical protein
MTSAIFVKDAAKREYSFHTKDSTATAPELTPWTNLKVGSPIHTVMDMAGGGSSGGGTGSDTAADDAGSSASASGTDRYLASYLRMPHAGYDGQCNDMNFASFLVPAGPHECGRYLGDADGLRQACGSSLAISTYYDRQYVARVSRPVFPSTDMRVGTGESTSSGAGAGASAGGGGYRADDGSHDYVPVQLSIRKRMVGWNEC